MAISTRSPNLENGHPRLPDDPPRLNGSGGSAAGERAWHQWMLVAVGLVALLAVLAIGGSFLALGSDNPTTTIIRQTASPTKAASTSAPAASHQALGSGALGSGAGEAGAGLVIPMVLQLDDTKGTPGTITGRPGWPRYAPSNITIPAGKQVTLVITNFDDAATPLTAGEPYNKVMGGTETVDGKSVTFVSNKVIAHTFTVTDLGVNVPIPMATGSGTTITFTFTAHKKGTFTWQCFTPCGSGKTGTEGPMMTPGFMTGTVTVV